MKRSFIMATAALFLVHGSVQALLPPLWEGVAEIKAILSDEQLKDYLDSADIIESISKTSSGYLIKTNRSELEAIVEFRPQGMPGPAKFDIKFVKRS